MIIIGLLYARLRKLNLELSSKNKTIRIQNTKLTGLNNNKLEIYKRLSHDVINSIYQMETLANRAIKDYSNNDDLLELSSSVVGLKNQFSVILKYARDNLDGSEFSKTDVNIEQLITEILDLNSILMKGNGLSSELNIQVTSINANYEGLFVILLNLIHNAIKFSSNGGHLSVNTYSEDGFQIIRIRDDGIGFSLESLNRVNSGLVPLERTTSDHIKGTGIGLLTVFETAKNMNITLLFESELTRGTSVYLYMPTD